MRFSTRGRYGLQVMVDLAEFSAEGPVSLKSIAQRKNLSGHYLGQVIPNLRKAGLVKSIRGAQGGYILARPASAIAIGDIIRALEGPIMPVECGKEGSEECCRDTAFCATKEVLNRVQGAVNEVINSISLHDLLEKSNQLEANIEI